MADLTARIEALVGLAPGDLSVVVESDAGVVVDLDGDREVPAASTVKVLVLVATLYAVQRGTLTADRDVVLTERRVGGSGALAWLGSVRRLPLQEVLALMVVLSDNDATNAVLDLLGFDAVNDAGTRLGLRRTRLRRRMMDQDAVSSGRDNTTSAGELARILTALRCGRLLGPAGTRVALDLLAGQQSVDGLPALLPAGTWHGNKTGELAGLRHDMALLEAGGRWASVAVTATGLLDADGGVDCGVDRGASVLPTFAGIGAAVGQWLTAGHGHGHGHR